MSHLSCKKPPELQSDTLIVPDAAMLLTAIAMPLLLVGPDNIVTYTNDATESFLGKAKRRIQGENVATLLRFSSDRMNVALIAGEGDISAQDMDLETIYGTTTVDISISNVAGDPNWRLISISPRHGGRTYIGEHNEAGRQQALGAPAILGHEIKNPLAGIKGAAQLLARRIDTPGQALTDLIVQEVDRIARLLDQMQNLGSSQPSHTAPANIHLLIERAIRSIRAANKAMPEISINYDPSLPDVMIDSDAMVQILINLMQNAIHALENRLDGVIGISTRFVMSGALRDAGHHEGDRRAIKLPVEIVISDNGPGVPDHIEDELFAPFVTTKRDGQGLGLAIVRKLVTQMNSRIVYERDHGRSLTLFKLFLPVADKEIAS
jgi:two-component system, NtrC family, nitrogen regulation sensor histidine kinase GlnL